MRINRAKSYRRHLRFYRIVYGVKPPYKVLLDGNFIHACVSTKVDIESRISAILQGGKPSLYVPKAALKELASLGEAFRKSHDFARRHCRAIGSDVHHHGQEQQQQPPSEGDERDEGGAGEENVSNTSDAAKQILGIIDEANEEKYIVASQDESLKAKLRGVPGCPIIFITRTVMLMEQPSGKAKSEFEKLERKKTGVTDKEAKLVERLWAEKKKAVKETRAKQGEDGGRRLKKKAKGPNPLSVKRKASEISKSDRPERRPTSPADAAPAAATADSREGAEVKRRRKKKKKS